MTKLTSRGGLFAALIASCMSTNALARGATPAPGWSFDIAPYIWLPSVSGELRHALPAGLGGAASVNADAGDYLRQLNAAIAFAATVRNGRFALLTDVIYVSADTGSSRVSAVDIAGVGRNPISSGLSTASNSTLSTALWTLAGSYTVASGDWGHADVLAGFRYLGVEATTNYNVGLTLYGPRGTAGPSFGGSGRFSGREDIWNGIVGVRGRINISDSAFFVPYYLDIGAGGSNFTWQGFTGIGYQTGWAGVQLGWRYLSVNQGGSALVQEINMSGAYLAVNFGF